MTWQTVIVMANCILLPGLRILILGIALGLSQLHMQASTATERSHPVTTALMVAP